MMRTDLLAFKQYYLTAAKKIPVDSPFMNDINHKYQHSVDVLHIGEKILENTPELKTADTKFKTFAQKALLFHDVGRFKEALNRYKKEKKHIKIAPSACDHGLIGYNLMKKNPAYNDMQILFALRYHGKMMEQVYRSELYRKIKNSPHKEDIIKILYLVRDADKLSNLKNIKKEDHLKKDVFYRQLSSKALNAPLSESVKEQFLAKKTILFPTVYSFADRLLMVLSWIFDLNYEFTKETFVKNGYDKYLFSELKNYHHNKEDLKKIQTLIRETLEKKA